jgi:putative glycosyltransferase (TIGR04372 family)
MVKKLLRFFLIIFIGFPISVIVKTLNPIICFRFGQLHASRIGHFALDFGIYLSNKSNQTKKTIDIFTVPKPICNYYFFEYIKRHIFVVYGISFVLDSLKFFPNPAKNIITPSLETSQSFDNRRALSKSKKKLAFTKKENENGYNFLSSVGCVDINKLVCMNIRDSAYLQNTYSNEMLSSSHSYRDSDIEEYKLGVMSLIDRGYFVIRTGKFANKKLDIDHQNFLDYPFSELKSEFLDIWLTANCRFFISTSNGLECISDIFNVPILFINASPIGHINSWSKNCIWMPKIIVDKKTKKLISLKEQISMGITDLSKCNELKMTFSEYLNILGLEIQNNSQEEINNTFIEFLDKIENKSDSNRKDLNLHYDFWSILKTWKEFDKYHHFEIEEQYGILSNTFIKKYGARFLDNE